MSTYTRWYRDGTVTLTKGSSSVVGVNTYWLTAGLNPGDIFKVDGVDYEIVSITDNTHLTLAGNYAGTTGSDKAYAIVRNFTANTQARAAAQAAELIGDFAKYIDNDMQSIHGKSAYQIACEKGYVGTEAQWIESLKGKNAYQLAVANGYVGTESQWVEDLKGLSAYEVAVANGYEGTEAEWLESLKAAGEWSTLNTKIDTATEPLTWNTAALHNSLIHVNDLGTSFTTAQYNEIANSTFRNMWLGSYWTLPSGLKCVIAGFNYVDYAHTPGSITLMCQSDYHYWTDPETDSTTQTYGECDWYVNYRPTLIAELEEFFSVNGASKLWPYKVYSAVDYDASGAPSTYAVLESVAHMPTFSMYTGFSPHHAANPYAFASAAPLWVYPQLPIFRQGGININLPLSEGRHSYYRYLWSFMCDCSKSFVVNNVAPFTYWWYGKKSQAHQIYAVVHLRAS